MVGCHSRVPPFISCTGSQRWVPRVFVSGMFGKLSRRPPSAAMTGLLKVRCLTVLHPFRKFQLHCFHRGNLLLLGCRSHFWFLRMLSFPFRGPGCLPRGTWNSCPSSGGVGEALVYPVPRLSALPATVAVLDVCLMFLRRLSRSCLTSLCCSTGGVVLRYVCIAYDGIRPHRGGILPHPCLCGILLRGGGILLHPYLFMSGVVLLRSPTLLRQYPASPLSLRYPSSLWRYPTSSVSLHAWRGLVAVSYFAAAASCLARVVVGLYRCLVAAPVYGCREVGMWREIICNFDLLRFTLQVMCAPPCRTTPMGLPSFPSAENVFSPRKTEFQTPSEIRYRNVQAQKHSDSTKQIRPGPSFFELHRFIRVIVFNFRRRRSLVQASLNLSLRCLVLYVGPLRSGGAWSGPGWLRRGTYGVGGHFLVT